MQQRICDCLLRIGGCYCPLTNEEEDEKTTEDCSRRDNINS